MVRICLIEDESDLHQILKFYLEKSGFSVYSCKNIQESTKYLKEAIDLWVVDIMLPDGNGLELLKTIKGNNSKAPVIIISAKGDCFDRVTGFEIGCDDYISKPFLPAELVYRVEKLLKTTQYEKEENNLSIIEIPPYKIDITKRVISLNDDILEITSREYDIICFFIEHKGQAISREFLLNSIWSNDYFGSDRVVDNYIKNIRKKLPFFAIETIYGFGYRYN